MLQSTSIGPRCLQDAVGNQGETSFERICKDPETLPWALTLLEHSGYEAPLSSEIEAELINYAILTDKLDNLLHTKLN